MAILKVKDNNGNEIPIPAIRGKSAYQYAKEGGYTGTEDEFKAKMAEELVIDSELSGTSENPVQNKVITNEINQLSEQIVDEVEDRKQAISDLEVRLNQIKLNYAEGDTVEEALAWLKVNGDQSLWYVMPDGFFYHVVEREIVSESVPNFTNILKNATVTLNSRYSSSNAIKTQSGYIAVDYITAKKGDVFRFVPVTLADDTSQTNMYARFRCYSSSGILQGHEDDNIMGEYESCIVVENGVLKLTIPYVDTAKVRMNLWVSTSEISALNYDECIVTLNEEITYTTTSAGTEKVWESTGIPIYETKYDSVIAKMEAAMEQQENRLTELEKDDGFLEGMEVYAPSPQLPADGSETADFNADVSVITAEQIYEYLEPLLTKYSRYITKETMGKDESGNYDWNRYVLSRRGYDAWVTPNKPKMYAWVNGSTVIYARSVSPRIGDTMYSTAYIGTAYNAVTAVNNANQTRTVNGLVFSRDSSKDVEPTLVYTLTKYSPYFNTVQFNQILNSNKSKISTISTLNGGSMTSSDGITYTRYPLGDRTINFEKLPTIVIGSNEHGTGGDPAEPAIISARMMKDLCECKQMDNAFLNLLKNKYMIIFCPVINPWGFSAPNQSYFNSNSVNLDRNLDTPGWGNDSSSGGQGAYGGSEVEMQYFMNTIVESGAKIVIANHGVGAQTNSTTGEGISAGLCHWMLGRDNSKYTNYLVAIGEVMNVNYNLAFTDYGQAPPETHAKTRSYIDWVGAEGGAVEMQPRDGFVLAGEGGLHTARIMEANYTLHLQFLHMLLACQGK